MSGEKKLLVEARSKTTAIKQETYQALAPTSETFGVMSTATNAAAGFSSPIVEPSPGEVSK